MTRLYDLVMARLHCCGCIVGIVALPVLTAGAFTTWTVMT